MAENKKSIIEEALLDVQRIQEALNSNTKEILRSVAKGEIDSVVKESLMKEDDYEEEDMEDGDDELALASADDAGAEGDEEAADDMEGDDEAGMDDMEGDDAAMDADDADLDAVSYDGGEESGEDYEMDMTGASDDDIIAVYKKLSGDDEIEVVSDNEVHIKDPNSGAEYHVKLGGGEAQEPAMDDMGADLGMGMEDEAMGMGYAEGKDASDDVVFEIEMTEDDEVSETEKITEEAMDGKVRNATSDITMGKEAAAPNTGNIEDQNAPVGNENDDNWAGDNLEGGFDDDGQNGGSGDAHADHIMENDDINEEEDINEDEIEETKYVGGKVQKVATAHTNHKLQETVEKYNALVGETARLKNENEAFKKQNEEFRQALKKFKSMLGETVVFNTNLTNVTRLFTEHTTTKEEKESIISRFDEEARTINESKRLYKTIKSELTSKKPISESIENKISKEVGSSASQLTESTAYVDASTKKIMDIMKKIG